MYPMRKMVPAGHSTLFKGSGAFPGVRLKDRAYTMTLSNIGPVQMEPEYADLIERFHLMIGVSRRQPVKCAVCAYKDEMVITFTSVFADSRLQKRFFRKLKEDGVPVRFEGNEFLPLQSRICIRGCARC